MQRAKAGLKWPLPGKLVCPKCQNSRTTFLQQGIRIVSFCKVAKIGQPWSRLINVDQVCKQDKKWARCEWISATQHTTLSREGLSLMAVLFRFEFVLWRSLEVIIIIIAEKILWHVTPKCDPIILPSCWRDFVQHIKIAKLHFCVTWKLQLRLMREPCYVSKRATDILRNKQRLRHIFIWFQEQCDVFGVYWTVICHVDMM